MQPFKIDPDGTPCFTTNDVDDYGFPELYGFEIYRIIDSRDKPMVSDFKMEHQYDLRPIHRYDRIARFKSTLFNIIGERGSVPEHVVNMVSQYIGDTTDPWNDCRRILKHYKQRAYYNRIPFIINRLKLGKGYKVLGSTIIDEIINKFKSISDKFERAKDVLKRRYFPNIRFIVLKLLEHYNIETGYTVPLVRTARKNKTLNLLWDDLIKDL